MPTAWAEPQSREGTNARETPGPQWSLATVLAVTPPGEQRGSGRGSCDDMASPPTSLLRAGLSWADSHSEEAT